VTRNRPDSLNALDPSLIDALNAYFESLQRNRRTRMVVLKGAGQAFCAGLDLKHKIVIRFCAAARKISARASGHFWKSESRSISAGNKQQ
jgi:enoyl-CoA hydratase/carnithine racemase